MAKKKGIKMSPMALAVHLKQFKFYAKKIGKTKSQNRLGDSCDMKGHTEMHNLFTQQNDIMSTYSGILNVDAQRLAEIKVSFEEFDTNTANNLRKSNSNGNRKSGRGSKGRKII